MIKYVAFGTDCFCRFKFQPVRNAEEFSTLPAETILSTGDKLPGGLIGYPIGYKNGMPSDEAWDASFELMADRKAEKMFSFQLKDKRSVYYISSKTLELMPKKRRGKMVQLDFNFLALMCDYAYINRDAICCDANGLFKGWELHDTILVMNPSVVIAKKK